MASRAFVAEELGRNQFVLDALPLLLALILAFLAVSLIAILAGDRAS